MLAHLKMLESRTEDALVKLWRLETVGTVETVETEDLKKKKVSPTFKPTYTPRSIKPAYTHRFLFAFHFDHLYIFLKSIAGILHF